MTLIEKTKELFRDYLKKFDKRDEQIDFNELAAHAVTKSDGDTDPTLPEMQVFYNDNAWEDLELESFLGKINRRIPHYTDYDANFVDGILKTPRTDAVRLNYRLDAILELQENPVLLEMLKKTKSIGTRLNHDNQYHRDSSVERLYKRATMVELVTSISETITDPKSDFLRSVKVFADNFVNDEKYQSVKNVLTETVIKNDLAKKLYSIRSKINDGEITSVESMREFFKTSELIRESTERILSEPEFAGFINKEVSMVDFLKTYSAFTKELNSDLFSFKSVFDRDERDRIQRKSKQFVAMTNYWLTLMHEAIDAKIPEVSIDDMPEELGYYIAAATVCNEWKDTGKPLTRPTYLPFSSRAAEILNSYNISIIDNKNIIPNDIISDPKNNVFIITGPNNGGKTTYIRQVGQMYWLAHIGMPLPAESAKMSVIDGIFTSFTGKDDTEAGTGQYLTELKRIKEFTIPNGGGRIVTPYSLLFFDEFANGTDHEEAVYRTKIVLDHLSNKGVTSYFTTHKHEISEYVNQGNIAGSMNLASTVDASTGTIIPTHKIIRNATEKSYGYVTAESVGITENTLKGVIEKELADNRYYKEDTRV